MPACLKAASMTHLDQLAEHVPGLTSRRILDVGAGRGKFTLDAASRRMSVTALEPYGAYRALIQERAAERGLAVEVVGGSGEKLPFADASFGFANVSEVVEHVEDPEKVVREVYRVLQDGGAAYVSIPNRFGMKDQHFHLYFVNWLPRAWADYYISLFGRHKDYQSAAGRQRLAEMHYRTYGAARALLEGAGFSVEDIREKKIRRRAGAFAPLLLALYRPLRAAYFDSFHLLATKPAPGVAGGVV